MARRQTHEKKLGTYPSMSLAQAREIFKRDYADVIQKGRSIKIATDTRPGTVADLFEGYVASLKAAGKPSWKRQRKASTRSPTRSNAIDRPVRSSLRRSSSLSGRSTSVALARWPIMCDVTSTRPIVGG